MAQEKIRLQKYISECGYLSRRKAEEMIAKGQVFVNGKKAIIGDKVDPYADEVKINGEKLKRPDSSIYIMLHKPRGFITTMNDEVGRKCVASLVKDVSAPVFPVGRLDRNSEGLLLFTNDGEFANTIMHPRYGIKKTYRVTVSRVESDEQIKKLSKGVYIDGRLASPAKVTVIQKYEDRDVLEIVIGEGRNREVRRMCEAASLEVKRLKRTAIGTLKLGMLKPGSFRELSQQEVAGLMDASKLT